MEKERMSKMQEFMEILVKFEEEKDLGEEEAQQIYLKLIKDINPEEDMKILLKSAEKDKDAEEFFFDRFPSNKWDKVFGTYEPYFNSQAEFDFQKHFQLGGKGVQVMATGPEEDPVSVNMFTQISKMLNSCWEGKAVTELEKRMVGLCS